MKSRKLAVITLVYWFLLLYIVAALVWWFISLEKQNRQMSTYKLQELKLDDVLFEQKFYKIEDERKRKTGQYIGEGVTFLALILIGAVFVYRATRRQLRLSIQQQNFMMAITHELKTPIAITLLNLETLQKRKLEESQQQKLISNTMQEANRLNLLCNNILLASQLDAGAYKLTKTEFNLSEVVDESLADFRSRFPNRTIDNSVAEQVYFVGEELLLQIVVNNLLENALKYTPKDKPILVELSEVNRHICFKVSDNGAGIPDNEKEKIFEKFYRIGNESTRNAKGTGLGLYLCKRIVQDHGGEIFVKHNHPEGSIFTVLFKS